ncbi:MAG TPA: GNAT family N-acetyltransferase [Streptosporangiaceae bacterium]|jgi:acyl-CoA synthetase (NDP forming)/GNAT superfamily N-acetyltransferase|nr:GNAT family N-acetyltransferase [Streptosporangiaceae bacterium]
MAKQAAGAYALLTDGSSVLIRQARTDDAEAVHTMHAAMSQDNMYLRFFSLSPGNAEREAERVCRAAEPGHVALLACRGPEVVGVATYEMNDNAPTAEVALAVADRFHRHGIATLLLEHLVSIARQHHVQAFTATTLAENFAMLHIFRDAGLPVQKETYDGAVDVTIPLPSEGDASLYEYLEAVERRESRADVASLKHLFMPESVAVIGASRRPDSVGARLLSNIVAGGFPGLVIPVNPHADSLAGLPCVATVDDLPDGVDLAIVVVPARAVGEVAERCGRRGVRCLVVITSGLADAGPGLLATCRRYGMRLVGPNCFGIAAPGLGLDATFGRGLAGPGIAGVAVQSGGIGVSLTEHLSRLGIGVSSFVSTGDKFDVSSNDLLAWWEQDQQTKLAILYLESFGNPRKFARTARRVGQRIPVLTVVGGRSLAGQRAATSHTAAAATPLVAREALFAQAGIVAAESLGQIIDAAAFLACQPYPSGTRVAVLTNAGGAGVLAADACGDSGLSLAALAEPTRQRLEELLPAGASFDNPVDTTAAIHADIFRACLEAVSADEAVDAVLSVTVPTAVADPSEAVAGADITKPFAAVVLDQAEDVRLLPRAAASGKVAGSPSAVPCYAYPEGAARALGHAARYGAWLSRPKGCVPELPGVRSQDARAVVSEFLRRTPAGGWLPAAAVGDVLRCYQIPQVSTAVAASEHEAVAAAADLPGPVVLKAVAAGLVHKTEAGAVKLDLRTMSDVKAAYHDLASSLGARLTGVLVQPMIRGGVEVLIGVAQEPVFGPLIVFGLGGVATDVLGDHAARLSPLTDGDARELVRSVRAAALLEGFRGGPKVSMAALEDVLLRVSRLADDLPEVAELDLNPVIAKAEGCLAADARIRIAPAEPQDPFLRRLR